MWVERVEGTRCGVRQLHGVRTMVAKLKLNEPTSARWWVEAVCAGRERVHARTMVKGEARGGGIISSTHGNMHVARTCEASLGLGPGRSDLSYEEASPRVQDLRARAACWHDEQRVHVFA